MGCFCFPKACHCQIIADWLNKDIESLISMKILLLLMCHTDLRATIQQLSEIPEFLQRVCTTRNDEALTCVSTLLRRLTLTQEFIQILSDKGFLKEYFDVSIYSRNEATVRSALLFFDACGRVTYNPIYMKIVQIIPTLLEPLTGYSLYALSLAVVLAYYPETKKLMKSNGMIDVVKRMTLSPSEDSYRNNFLSVFVN